MVRNDFLAVGAALLALTSVSAADQSVTLSEPVRGADGSIEVSATYDTFPAGVDRLTGLGLRVHYDSSLISSVEMKDVLPRALLGVQSGREDIDDADGDASTDRYVLVAWADVEAAWPGVTPVELFRMTLSGVAGPTRVTLTAADTAVGEGFSGDSVALEP